MEKTPNEQLEAIKSYLKQTSRFENKSVEQIRRNMLEAVQNIPNYSNIEINKAAIGPLSGEWLIPKDLIPEHEKRAILYFHGGGFVAGTCEFYRDLCSRIAISSGIPVLTIDYRLAPEHLYPAANEDCLLAYRWLLSNGYSAHHIIFGGDSVGGSLVLMTLLSLRENGVDLPACAFLISPHTDLVHLDGEIV
ncbi:steryl acetyl hydrolase [Paenibacillus pinisoli]|uniref:Steryl acetyl hydrolase n=1 Tax=Paenibacillus pinisoli TaxID=1276110 RepID=A0A3A6PVP2_9BACL|nr:alpha/beta hydrolase fold domain-containing protein [Paenibacillus pinisoli]RJX37934.1 steryl acetyl hydrolase [Paenibacillus pinisoli]